ncbi:MAG: type II toxin-antitoxin system VapC family toxin [Methanobacteriaceae archaeon]|nr:type II toxin-antitoxin system VapC family toxin [Methanobacteriaceae archaeon]
MIFVDSSLIIAMVLTKDQWHQKAVQLIKKINNEEKVISDLMVAESITSIGDRKGGKEAINIFNYLQDNFTVISTDFEFLKSIKRQYLKYDGTLSIADTSAVEIMKNMKITQIASFDRDFDKVEGIVRIH